ncbi:hypothetical protein DB347_03990 [Opitutaceae bacterium EW11]|nr:hypothetical protein DB347_03990 [Opitutaceae bacterium EW11]
MKFLSSQRFYALYSGVLTAVLAVLVFSGFTDDQTSRGRWDEITVQRINVVEPDGTLRMIISNNARGPGIYIKGKEHLPGHHGAGMIFLNDEGSENGGLSFAGATDAQGNVSSLGHLSFDRYLQDQVITMTNKQQNDAVSSTFNVLDQPSWPISEYIDLLERIASLPPDQQNAEVAKFLETHPLGAPRITLGRDPDKSAGLELKDPQGRVRATLKVGADGAPRLQLLNADGSVIAQLPQ